MIPSALVEQLQEGMADFLRASFESSTPGFAGAIDRLLQDRGAVMKGPYLQVSLPFRRGSRPDFFPAIPLSFTPFAHQERAFHRLSNQPPLSTLVATGTGSGKTESFLIPILAHCLANSGRPGIKAILIYPMNALVGDQALRLARLIHSNPQLRGSVRAGLYIGEGDQKGQRHGSMGTEHLIDDRDTLRINSPDILLTNYKMLDYLLARPADRELWRETAGGALRFLVVDELHTFDGAQGTDLACLVRRLKDRLSVATGELCCIGTSATLGGPEAGADLRDYAQRIFGEPFDENSVISEDRLSLTEWLATTPLEEYGCPDPNRLAALDPLKQDDPDQWVRAQAACWFDHELPGDPVSDEYRVSLGERLRRHTLLRGLLEKLGGAPRPVLDLVAELDGLLAGTRDSAQLGPLSLLSLVGLISHARVYRDELPAIRAARQAEGKPQPLDPFLQVRVQLWQRELARIVASVEDQPCIAFSDDLTGEQRARYLPAIHCRECGSMGWATRIRRDRPHAWQLEKLSDFYNAFFGKDPSVYFVYPAQAIADGTHPAGFDGFYRLDRKTLTAESSGHRRPDELSPDEETALVSATDAVLVARIANHRTINQKRQLHRDCPFCGSHESLTLVGFRAATLTSVYIGQLFASRFNEDKKLLAFSDAVQDAAHRAGFFGARTWQLNLRVALRHFLDDGGEGLTLAELPSRFCSYWREVGRMEPARWITTFLPPNLAWLKEWEALKQTGEINDSTNWISLIERRLGWELGTEFSLQARIGRSLPRTRSAVAAVPGVLIAGIAQRLNPVLNEEVGRYREVPAGRLQLFLEGMLHRMLERGGVMLPDLRGEYIESAGAKTFTLSKKIHLPDYGPKSRLPALLTDKPGTERFDAILSGRPHEPSWVERWSNRCFATGAALEVDAGAVLRVVMPELVRSGVLEFHQLKGGGIAWALRLEALRVTRAASRIECDHCHYASTVSTEKVPSWTGAPCFTARCTGHMRLTPGSGPVDYFARLYAHGDVERLFPEEHTGLLARTERERIEEQFKAAEVDRKPWFPNLLSCTPTLEMGIDVGDLSSTVLCSIPPTQANYLQRVGRAGRRDGNALVLSVANARPHDLYFFAEPAQMIAGRVTPPGVYLGASAVLERQLFAFCFDRWVADSPVAGELIPHKVRGILSAVETKSKDRFPHTLFSYVENHREQLAASFTSLFGQDLAEETRALLRAAIDGGVQDEGSLLWRAQDAFQEQIKFRDDLRGRVRRLTERIKQWETDQPKAAAAPDGAPEETDLDKMRREKKALNAVLEQILDRDTFGFLTDEGLLPNYAFPEAPVRLKSIIWRTNHNTASSADTPANDAGSPRNPSKYEVRSYEYARAPSSALAELAPDNSFYAGGRRVEVDQVDVSTTAIEAWRFCASCDHAARDDLRQPVERSCPHCGDGEWSDSGRVRDLIRLRQVFATTEDRRSRFGDDEDQRTPKFYERQMLVAFDSKQRVYAWRLPSSDLPFAFEYVRKATFRDINFGARDPAAPAVRIGGKDANRPGFVLCRHCGKVQHDPAKPEHSFDCPAKRPTAKANFDATVWLYRQFESEALRILLPVTEFATDREVFSFLAALQLGLRRYFGGQVDHLQATLTSEPSRDQYHRKRFLVLYDRVPGGTGYLKELAHDPSRLLSLLRLAHDQLVTCSCRAATDDAKALPRDGCYRCLFAYRISHDMEDLSSRSAEQLLARLLGADATFEKIDSLSDIQTSAYMDSVLEARFIEALRRANRSESGHGRRVKVESALVGGKTGYRVTVGERTWNVELQAELGANQGLGIATRADFLFHPAFQRPEQRPIAVYLDGWEYHRDRIAKDFVQRMALRSSGRYDVWALTWQDMEVALAKDADRASAPDPLPDATNRRTATLEQAGLRNRAVLLTRPAFEWFLLLLEGEIDEAEWDRLAHACLFSQASLVPEQGKEWIEAIQLMSPPVAHPLLTGRPIEIGHKRALREDDRLQLFTLMEKSEATKVAQGLVQQRPIPRAMRALVFLDDEPREDGDERERREAWASLVRLFALVRSVNDCWFVTRQGLSDQNVDYAAVAELRSFHVESAGDSPWRPILAEVAAGLHAVVRQLEAENMAVPEVGMDLPDPRGRASSVCGELTWPELRVAILAPAVLRPDAGTIADRWLLFNAEDVLADGTILLSALRERGGKS